MAERVPWLMLSLAVMKVALGALFLALVVLIRRVAGLTLREETTLDAINATLGAIKTSSGRVRTTAGIANAT